MDEYGREQVQLQFEEDTYDYEEGPLHHHHHQQQPQPEQDEEEQHHQQQRQEQHQGELATDDGSNRDSSLGKLFVGGVSWETTQETFANYFSKYGEITDSVIMMDKHSGRPRGFGFITFADPVVADKVLEEEHVIDGRTVEVKRTVPREDMEVNKGVTRTKKIFVGGIPPSLSEDDLKEYFSLYGSIVEHQIMLDHKTGRSRGFGFVTFESEESVDKVFSEGRTHELGGKEVEIKRAVPKRAGSDFGGPAKSYGGFSKGGGGYGGGAGSRHASSGGGYGFGDRYGGKMGRGFGSSSMYGGFGAYGGYGNYGGSYGGSAAGFYGGYGGYGYGFGFGGPMYGSGGGGYGGSGYGAPSGYGGAAGYGGGKGYGRAGGGADGGYGSSRGYGSGGDGSYGGGRDYGNGVDGGYGSGRGYDNGGDVSYASNKGYGIGPVGGRYHPYRK